MTVRFLILSAAVAGTIFAPAASAARAANALPACNSAERHQFDFWLGSWRVADASGKLQGTNVVTSEYGGCALQEHWKGASGSVGSSFNTYMPGRRQWHQTWVDNSGGTLILFGGIVGKSMVLSGTRIDPRTKNVIVDRITWTPLGDGRVRQHWQQSDASRQRWTEVFDGYYSKITRS